MCSFRSVILLAAILGSNVLGQEVAPNHDLDGRQIFASVATCTRSICPTTAHTSSKAAASTSSTRSTSFVLTRSSAPASPSSTRSTVSRATSTASATPTVSYNPYAVITTFTQPPACTGGLSLIKDWGNGIYDNPIFSSASYNLTYTTCYPRQFYSSVLAKIASTTLPPFKALVCPYRWENYQVNSTYVICCPNGFSLIAPNYDDPVRPAAGAACSSYIGASALIDITTFDSRGSSTTVPTTLGSDGTIVWGYAFEGFTITSTSPTQSKTMSSILTSSVSKPKVTSSTTKSTTTARPVTSASTSGKSPSVSARTAMCLGSVVGVLICEQESRKEGYIL